MVDNYKIGILVKVTNQASSVLGLLERDFIRSEKAALRLQSAMKDLRIAAGLGLAAGTLAFGLEKAIKPANEYQHQLVTLNSTLQDHAKMVQAVQAAWATSSEVKTTSATENLKAIADLIPALNNNFDHVVANLSTVQKLGSVITNLGGSSDQAFDIAKALETRGAANDPARFTREAGLMAQVAEYTHNRVNAREYLGFIRQSAPFATSFSEDFLYKMAPTLIQDRGGMKAGTGLASFENVLVGGRMTKAAAAMMQQLGLLDTDALAGAREGAAGTLQLAKGKQVRGSDLAVSDPFQWVQQYLLPALTAKGVNDPKQQEMIVAKMFSNINAERMAIEFIVNKQRYLADAGGISNTENPLAAYDRLSKTDPMMLNKQLTAQWADVLIRLGNTILPILIPATVKLVDGLDKLTHIMARHPTITKFAGEGVAALTVVLGLGAAFAGIGAALVVLNPAVVALSTALTGLAMVTSDIMGGKVNVTSPTAVEGQERRSNMMQTLHNWMHGKAGPAPYRKYNDNRPHQTVLKLDGRTVATMMTDYQTRMASGPSLGPSSFDGLMSYRPSGH